MESIQELFSLDGHVGLVTGASSGLGIECARALAIGGAAVALVARRKDRLERVAAELTKRYGARTLVLPADITDSSVLDGIVSHTVEALGDLDILVNNAGIATTGRAERVSSAAWESALSINLTAPLMLSQRFARRLIEARKPGRIINITSMYGQFASAIYRLAPYVATKAALTNLTRQLAVEWAGYGINVNAIAPGWFPTEMNEEGMSKGYREKMEKHIPLGRLGKPEELRGIVIFLSSPAASYATGSVFTIDGGNQSWC